MEIDKGTEKDVSTKDSYYHDISHCSQDLHCTLHVLGGVRNESNPHYESIIPKSIFTLGTGVEPITWETT